MKSLGAYLDELRGLDQHNIGSWPRWAYGFAIAVVATTIIVIASWYFVLPKKEELASAEAREPQLKQKFEIKQRLVANLDAYREQLATMKQEFGTLLKQLPSKNEVPRLLNDISQTRTASGLTEKLFKPRPEDKRDFYAVLPNDLIVTGDFHEFGRFVSGVAALPRIVTIQDVHIEPVGDHNSPGDGGKKLRMSVSADTYRYLDSDSATSAPPTQSSR